MRAVFRLVFGLAYLSLAVVGAYHFLRGFGIQNPFAGLTRVSAAQFIVQQAQNTDLIVIQPTLDTLTEMLADATYFSARGIIKQMMPDHNWIQNTSVSYDFQTQHLNVTITPKNIWGFIQHRGQFVPITAEGEILRVRTDARLVGTQPNQIFVSGDIDLQTVAFRHIPTRFRDINHVLIQNGLSLSQYLIHSDKTEAVFTSNGIRVDFFHHDIHSLLGKLNESLQYLNKRFDDNVKAIQFISSKKAVVSFNTKTI